VPGITTELIIQKDLLVGWLFLVMKGAFEKHGVLCEYDVEAGCDVPLLFCPAVVGHDYCGLCEARLSDCVGVTRANRLVMVLSSKVLLRVGDRVRVPLVCAPSRCVRMARG